MTGASRERLRNIFSSAKSTTWTVCAGADSGRATTREESARKSSQFEGRTPHAGNTAAINGSDLMLRNIALQRAHGE